MPEPSSDGTHPTWRHELEERILPWWVAHGADDVGGGVLTCFDNAGALRARDKYTWSQGRWAWLAAEIVEAARDGRSGEDPEVWAQRAAGTARFLLTHTLLDDGRTVFVTDETGGHKLDPASGLLAPSVFADLFAVLGIGAAVRIGAVPVTGALSTAVDMLEGAHRRVRENTALTEPYPVPEGYDDMASWMNLFHTAAELLRISGMDADVRERISALRDDCLVRLIGDENARGFLGSDDWEDLRPHDARDRDSVLARHRTPGHSLELLWMLVHAERTGARIPADHDLERLALHAMDIGWDREHGGILRYADVAGGRPSGARASAPVPYEDLVIGTWSTKLWWVHAEAMYATALLADRTGSRALRDWHLRITRYTMSVFPDPEHGEWIQIRDRRGAPLEQVVALPVKDPFHIARSLLLLTHLDADEGDPDAPSSP